MPNTPLIEAKLVIPSRLDNLPRIRELVDSTAGQAGFGQQEIQRIVTAAFEAVVNAITHGSPLGSKNTISVDIRIFPDRFVVDVSDQGPGFQGMLSREMPDASSRRGRGLPLMQALVDEVQLSTTNGGRVTLTMYRNHSGKDTP